MTPLDEEQLDRRRRYMVQAQLVGRGITDVRVLAAMAAVPRHLFVAESQRDEAYDDCPLPIGERQTISQPYMVAMTCQRAELLGGERVLEVGAGSGYQAAVLGRLARSVVTIERIPALAEKARRALVAAGADNVEVVVGDGSVGWPPNAPYDAIVVAAAAPRVPSSLVAQLSIGGRLVLPVGSRTMQELRVIERTEDGVRQFGGDACVFVPLVGAEGFEADGRGSQPSG